MISSGHGLKDDFRGFAARDVRAACVGEIAVDDDAFNMDPRAEDPLESSDEVGVFVVAHPLERNE